MDLIILRHAEKNPGFAVDPSLSTHGLEQAEALAEILTMPRWGRPHKLFASPKQRTQQTLRPLANKLGLPIEILPELDERRRDETGSDFQRRIDQLVDTVTESTQIHRKRSPTLSSSMIWCSHFDWIEEFRGRIDCEEDLLRTPYDQWSPGQFIVLRSLDLWKVIGFGRAP